MQFLNRFFESCEFPFQRLVQKTKTRFRLTINIKYFVDPTYCGCAHVSFCPMWTRHRLPNLWQLYYPHRWLPVFRHTFLLLLIDLVPISLAIMSDNAIISASHEDLVMHDCFVAFQISGPLPIEINIPV